MRGGEFWRRLWRNKKRLVLLSVYVVSLAAALFVFLRLRSVQNTLSTQSAAEAWQGESDLRFAQVTSFFPQETGFDEAGVYSLRQTLTKTFSEQSLETPEGGSLLHDAYCAYQTLAASSQHAELSSVKTLGVGGDWFYFHPLRLINGSYITESDFMNDRVVLEETLAWSLFGSSDIAGQYIRIGTRNYPIAGVVKREDDEFTRGAVGEEPIGLFMSYEAMNEINVTPIACYEAAMPNPVENFAKNMLTDTLNTPAAEIVENTNRFSLSRLCEVIGSFAKRSMNTKGVIYPYWENAARFCENTAAILLVMLVVLLIPPTGIFVLQVFHYGKQYIKQGKEKLKAAIEKRIEEKKKKNYVREGI